MSPETATRTIDKTTTAAQAAFLQVHAQLSEKIIGQADLIDRLLIALLADGHLLGLVSVGLGALEMKHKLGVAQAGLRLAGGRGRLALPQQQPAEKQILFAQPEALLAATSRRMAGPPPGGRLGTPASSSR